MNGRLLVTLATLAAGPSVASANSMDYFRQYGLLAEVSADPRDGSDFVQVNPMHADAVELVALNAPVDLRGMTVRFSDGRSFHTYAHGVLPGQPVTVDLPQGCGVITDVQLDYIPREWRWTDRTPARLQLVPVQRSYYQQPYQEQYQQPYQQQYERPYQRY